MKWFKRKKTIDNILDKDSGLVAKAGGWIGNLKLTDEEVMEHNGKLADSVQEYAKATMNESSARSESRREFTKKWSTMHIGIIILSCISRPFDSELAQFYLELALSVEISGITGAIVIFHYGSHSIMKFQQNQSK